MLWRMERFWQKVDRAEPDGCWLWQASLRPNGYGQFSLDGTMRYAHRVAYALQHGAIPAGHVLDHLCGVKHCVNPAHLDAVTQRENVARDVRRGGHEPGRWQRELTACAQGHAYDEANTYHHGGRRYCRACRAAKARRRYHERAAA